MKTEPGCPAVSLAGHDRGRYVIIVAEVGERVVLADGRIRTVASPKRKNRKHIQAASQPLPVGTPVTDEAIRRELARYEKLLRRKSAQEPGQKPQETEVCPEPQTE
ncbi:MAG: KOW domain-containing RNA-binding protein [Clostridiales bacterium]|nr:KOW domain-containing RNA-binding protein [Clostridiales bacterium]